MALIKGWYCNITRPARFGPGRVTAEDLALDVFVYPDGRTLVLDEEEFADMKLPASGRREAAWRSRLRKSRRWLPSACHHLMR